MTDLERGQRRILGSLFTTMMLVIGPYLPSIAVLFNPWVKEFHWDHAQVGEIAAVSSFVGALISPVGGWLIDLIGVQWLMGAGFAVVGGGLLLVAHVHTHFQMMLLYAAIGMGVALAGFLPVTVVTVNWFTERRGLASGFSSFGLAVGMTATPPLLTWVILKWGWRVAVQWFALPALFIALPLVLLLVRTRPPNAQARNMAEEIAALPGLEVWPALGTLTFWMLMATQFFNGLGMGAVLPHQITFLIGVGYSPEHAALVYSAQTAVAGFGVITMGALCDKFSGIVAVRTAMASMTVSILALLGCASTHYAPLMIAAFALFWGAGAGSVQILVPILLAETLGLRRLGTLTGIKFLASALALAIGPWASGALYDMTGSYTLPFLLAGGTFVLTALSVSIVRPVPGHDVIPGTPGGELKVGTAS